MGIKVDLYNNVLNCEGERTGLQEITGMEFFDSEVRASVSWWEEKCGTGILKDIK
jgi:hypothetical protein